MLSGRLNPEILLAIAVAGSHAARRAVSHSGFFPPEERPLLRASARTKRCRSASPPSRHSSCERCCSPWFPAPEPRYHGEFSFLLAPSTLAGGRLVNHQQHRTWMRFNMSGSSRGQSIPPRFPSACRPLYPEKSFSEASGPESGSSTAFMCRALCWMLQIWLPPRWALLGALLAVLRFSPASYWMNTCWGGSLARKPAELSCSAHGFPDSRGQE